MRWSPDPSRIQPMIGCSNCSVSTSSRARLGIGLSIPEEQSIDIYVLDSSGVYQHRRHAGETLLPTTITDVHVLVADIWED
jgi:hypothetical protein